MHQPTQPLDLASPGNLTVASSLPGPILAQDIADALANVLERTGRIPASVVVLIDEVHVSYEDTWATAGPVLQGIFELTLSSGGVTVQEAGTAADAAEVVARHLPPARKPAEGPRRRQ